MINKKVPKKYLCPKCGIKPLSTIGMPSSWPCGSRKEDGIISQSYNCAVRQNGQLCGKFRRLERMAKWIVEAHNANDSDNVCRAVRSMVKEIIGADDEVQS